MLSAFSTTLHVPNLSTPDHLLSVLEEVDLFSKDEVASLHAKLQGKRYVFTHKVENITICVSTYVIPVLVMFLLQGIYRYKETAGSDRHGTSSGTKLQSYKIPHETGRRRWIRVISI